MSTTIQRGGKRAKKFKKRTVDFIKEVTLKEEDQEYGVVTKVNGRGIYEIKCYDNVNRLGHKRGMLCRGKNKANIAIGNTILLSKRSYQDGVGDIILVYSDDDVRKLIQQAELPSNGNETNTEDDLPFEFESI